MSKLFVDDIVEKTSGHGVSIPGHVIQVVQGTSTTYTTLGTNNTYTDSGLTAAITPKFASSKVLILHNAPIVYQYTEDMIMRVLRGSTNVYQLNFYAGNDANYHAMGGAFQFLDSPSTTSAITYKTQIYKNRGSFLYSYNNEVTSTSTLTLMEIAQ
tara:strand:- start:573 stop:1040 length:468 start_codon:yes stop_codon:yes gene_type:complete